MTTRTPTFQRILGVVALSSFFILIFFIVTRGKKDTLTLWMMPISAILLYGYAVISAPKWRELLIKVADNSHKRNLHMAFAPLILNVVDWILSKFPTNKNKKD